VTQVAQTTLKFDAIAWKFVGSEFAGQTYADWPIERRLDGYLLHHGLVDVFDDGSACEALLGRVMDNIGRAVRDRLLRRHVDTPSLANPVAAASLPPDVSGRRRHR
jgi:hypothetical protein